MKCGWRSWLLAVCLTLLGACSGTSQPWALRDISGLLPPLDFTLRDGAGQVRSASDFAGEVTLLYFGYTHCPDVCPATLAQLAGVLRRLDGAARRVRILFVSVDPARDTPAVLQAYANAFGPQVVGLSGTPKQLRQVAKRYRVSFGLGKPDAAGHYEVSHSSAVFIFDSRGEARLLATQDDSADSLAGDLRRLLAADTARVL
jgi:protein SCO1/2